MKHIFLGVWNNNNYYFFRKGKKEWEITSTFPGVVVCTAKGRSAWDFRVV